MEEQATKQVVTRSRVRLQINEIAEYLSQHNILMASHILDEIWAGIRSLSFSPLRGARLSNIYDCDSVYRFIRVPNYKIVYKVQGDVVTVMAIWHNSRDPKKLLRQL